jgi:predicted CXXCH cytochrome family protein
LRGFDHRWPWISFAILLWPASGQSDIVCAACHPKETALYSKSPMGNSLGPPVPVPAGRVLHQRSESVIAVEPGVKMIHRLSVRGLTAEYAIDYQIGAGILAHSYIAQVNGYLFESPVTWFRSSGWDVSPGYARAPAVDFDRPITETCLFCHAGLAKFSGGDGRRPAGTALTGITCERCHGPSEDHVRRPSASNIVNPRKLPARARDSVCEQCHLEGAVRVLNPGKNWWDFRPGENFEGTVAVYILNQNGHEAKAVSQFEQLAESQCASRSGGQMWCGTCHQPHGEPTDRSREISRICLSCHASLSTVAHSNPQSECVSCHMPRLSSEYAHVAITDHRIVRRPVAPNRAAEAGSMMLAPWVAPQAEFRQRDLALAGLIVGFKQGMPSIGQDALHRLETIPKSQLADDPVLLAASCEAMLERGGPQAKDLCRQALEKQPESADRSLAFGKALDLSGDPSGAERQFSNAIRLDPSLKRAYLELWTLYDRQHRIDQMGETTERYLNWNPRNILFRRLKAILTMESILSNLPWLVPPR